MFFQSAFYATYAYTSIDEKTIFSGANIVAVATAATANT